MTSMTDEELVELLRRMSPRLDMLDCENVLQAADRIEKLMKSIKNLSHLWATAAVNREVSEGKLEKAVVALQKLSCNCQSNCDWEHDDVCPSWTARAVLAELEKTE